MDLCACSLPSDAELHVHVHRMTIFPKQCRGVLLLLHIVGQGPAVLAAGVGWVGYIFLYVLSIFHF